MFVRQRPSEGVSAQNQEEKQKTVTACDIQRTGSHLLRGPVLVTEEPDVVMML
jgi:hypothetical protein